MCEVICPVCGHDNSIDNMYVIAIAHCFPAPEVVIKIECKCGERLECYFDINVPSVAEIE